jgi:hypothetical protein
MGLLDQGIQLFANMSARNKASTLEQQKFDYNRYTDDMTRALNVKKYMTETGFKLNAEDLAERKALAGSYNAQSDNLQGLLTMYRADFEKATDEGAKDYIKGLMAKIEDRMGKLGEGADIQFPLAKMEQEARDKGVDIDALNAEADKRFGRDLDDGEINRGISGKGVQGGQAQGSNQMVRRSTDGGRVGMGQNGRNGTSSNVSIPSSNVSNEDDITALQNQVQELIASVQGKIEQPEQPQESQPLNIPGRQATQITQPQEEPVDPRFNRQTAAQVEADKYRKEQYDTAYKMAEKANFDKLERKYKYIDDRGGSIEDEQTKTENEILSMMKDKQWIETMVGKGRKRSLDVEDMLYTGLRQLMGKKPKKHENVRDIWGVKYKTNTAALEAKIQAKKNKLEELNILSGEYTTQGDVELARPAQHQINTGYSITDSSKIEKRKSLYGGYR